MQTAISNGNRRKRTFKAVQALPTTLKAKSGDEAVVVMECMKPPKYVFPYFDMSVSTYLDMIFSYPDMFGNHIVM